MRRPIVAGNWKLHGSRAENARLVEDIMAQLPAKPAGQGAPGCIVCPPFVYLQEVARLIRGSSIELGAQDVCAEPQGAFTGEVSAAMLKDVGCEYVIVGHSERRLIYRGRRLVPHRQRSFGWFATVSHWDVEQHETEVRFEADRVSNVQAHVRRSRLVAPQPE